MSDQFSLNKAFYSYTCFKLSVGVERTNIKRKKMVGTKQLDDTNKTARTSKRFIGCLILLTLTVLCLAYNLIVINLNVVEIQEVKNHNICKR